jgi:hypothetical protein
MIDSPRKISILRVSLLLPCLLPPPCRATPPVNISGGNDAQKIGPPAEDNALPGTPPPRDDQGSGPFPAGIGEFSPSLFHFVTTVRDNGEGKGGGWQEAVTQLQFADGRHPIPHILRCQVKVGMPLRTKEDGRISPDYAAQITAELATAAMPTTVALKSKWMTAEFCKAFKDVMMGLFEEHHSTLGARVQAQ